MNVYEVNAYLHKCGHGDWQCAHIEENGKLCVELRNKKLSSYKKIPANTTPEMLELIAVIALEHYCNGWREGIRHHQRTMSKISAAI